MKKNEPNPVVSSPRWRALAGGLLPLSLLAAAGACSETDEEETLPQDQMDQRSTKAAASEGPGIMATGDFQWKARQPNATKVTGDINGDGASDLIISVPSVSNPLVGDLWTGYSGGDGTIFLVKNNDESFSRIPGMLALDYNGDGKDELLNFFNVDSAAPIQPVILFSRALGEYVPIVGPIGNGPEFSAAFLERLRWPGGGVRRLICDINGDGKDDVVLTGPTDWTTIPIAFSKGDGSFLVVTNEPAGSFPDWTEDQSAKLACDDINADGKDDLIVLGGAGTSSVATARSNGDGTFVIANVSNPTLAGFASEPHAQLVTGDINGDHRADLMLTGGMDWPNVKLGLSMGTGVFNPYVSWTSTLHLWARASQAFAVGGDFNADHLGELALLGGDDTWFRLPLGISDGNTGFYNFNEPVP